MNRVTEFDGNSIEITADPGVLRPGRLYAVDSEVRLAEGDAVSVFACELGAVTAVEAVFGGRMRRYGFTHGGTVKVTPQIMEQLGFSEVCDDPIGGE